MSLKKIYKFAKTNYFITIFIAITFFTLLFSSYKLFFSKSTYIYAKVKVGQGLWWASTTKPSIWFIDSLKKGEIEKDLTGKPIAEIIDERYYPWINNDQFDIYLTLKLKVSKLGSTGKYNFKRSTIGVGAPIDLEFPSVQVSGTIIQINAEPIKDQYIDKILVITKRNAYPWEYDAIKVGDKYFDGQNVIFEILDKQATNTTNIASDMFGNSNPSTIEEKKYITVKTRVKVKEKDEQLILGEDQLIKLGSRIYISTPNFVFTDYYVGRIE